MNKAILVIDMPESCDKCPLFGNHYSDLCCKALKNRSVDYPYPDTFRQTWCPLKQLPNTEDYAFGDWDKGHRAYLKDILGE